MARTAVRDRPPLTLGCVQGGVSNNKLPGDAAAAAAAAAGTEAAASAATSKISKRSSLLSATGQGGVNTAATATATPAAPTNAAGSAVEGASGGVGCEAAPSKGSSDLLYHYDASRVFRHKDATKEAAVPAFEVTAPGGGSRGEGGEVHSVCANF